MSNWKYKLDLTDVWNKVDDGKMTIPELGKIVADRLEKVAESFPKVCKGEATEIAYYFREAEEESDFNDAMEDLYNLADSVLPKPKGQWMENKLMWVATNF